MPNPLSCFSEQKPTAKHSPDNRHHSVQRPKRRGVRIVTIKHAAIPTPEATDIPHPISHANPNAASMTTAGSLHGITRCTTLLPPDMIHLAPRSFPH